MRATLISLTLVAIVASIVTLGGCALGPTTGLPDIQSMSAEQIKAFVSDKNFAAVCIRTPVVQFTYTNVDKTVVTNGAIAVNPDCSMTLSNAPNPPKVVVTP